MDVPHESSLPAGLRWINRYATLDEVFYTRVRPQGLPEPRWVATSDAAAQALGWPTDWWTNAEALAVFSGHALWPGMDALATVYSGHQFGVWAGQLGDGRAVWLGELLTPHGSMEVQLKGSGKTPYSRMGDGRAVLRSSIREFLCSEAMHALGLPTTRALCLVASPLPVLRETVETAAIVTRLAPSFVRFGHFEHFCHHGQPQALRRLADFVIDHHLPECRDQPHPYAALLETVVRRTAELVAQWQAVAFCHGVLNTDNMSILGLTIDYGPFGFLDAYDPAHICNHSDTQGRYSYHRQPQIALWNLHALAQALMPLIEDTDLALAALETFRSVYPQAWMRLMRAKLGLRSQEEGDAELIDDWLSLLARDRVDHTLAWRRLGRFSVDATDGAGPVRELFTDRQAFEAWASRYRQRLLRESSHDAERRAAMDRVNPKYILRNHLAEIAIRKAQAGDDDEVRRLLRVLQRPYDEQPEHEAYAALPPEWAQSIEVSCSS
ncbi:YdiU family protein [Caldimonas sp.]|uniref:protein adenylyltransferase SelO n=1 Tax=Caldimonas sp. TaxID=2838790 RepID=UPI00307F3C48